MIIDKIKLDLNAARKLKEKEKITILSTLYGEVERVGKDKGNRLSTDEESLSVIKKFIENARLCLEYDTDANDKILAEIAIYRSYQPKQLTEAEIKSIILELSQNPNADTTLPGIMKHFKAEYPGKYDGKLLTTIIKGVS